MEVQSQTGNIILKVVKYTALQFLPRDSIMKLREGITDLDGLRQFAKEVYPDYTDEMRQVKETV